jgi:hypothetical protein
MNQADKKYARERVEAIGRDVKQTAKCGVPHMNNPKNQGCYLTNEDIIDALTAGILRVPSQKEAVAMFQKTLTKQNASWTNTFLIGYDSLLNAKKKRMEEDYETYLKEYSKYNDFNMQVDREVIKIVDEIMLSKDCNLSALTTKLMAMKFEQPKRTPIRKRK